MNLWWVPSKYKYLVLDTSERLVRVSPVSLSQRQ